VVWMERVSERARERAERTRPSGLGRDGVDFVAGAVNCSGGRSQHGRSMAESDGQGKSGRRGHPERRPKLPTLIIRDLNSHQNN